MNLRSVGVGKRLDGMIPGCLMFANVVSHYSGGCAAVPLDLAIRLGVICGCRLETYYENMTNSFPTIGDDSRSIVEEDVVWESIREYQVVE